MQIFEGDGLGVALILPGQGYSGSMPLLWYARLALQARGWSVRVAEWDDHRIDSRDDLVSAVGTLIDDIAADQRMIVAKSKGCFGLPAALERSIPGVWLTPVMKDVGVLECLPRLTPPSVLIGGTADHMWDGTTARTAGVEVIEVAGADHSLEVPGDVDQCLAALRTVCGAVDRVAAEVEHQMV
jgi:hypothetical protein